MQPHGCCSGRIRFVFGSTSLLRHQTFHSQIPPHTPTNADHPKTPTLGTSNPFVSCKPRYLPYLRQYETSNRIGSVRESMNVRSGLRLDGATKASNLSPCSEQKTWTRISSISIHIQVRAKNHPTSGSNSPPFCISNKTSHCKHHGFSAVLDELLESTVDRRSRLDPLVEINSGQGTFGNPFGGELEFLPRMSAHHLALL